MSTTPRYPGVVVQLTSEDGNALTVLGLVKRGLRGAGVDEEEVLTFLSDATSGDYNHLLATAAQWVQVK